VHELIVGQHKFYDEIFADLGVPTRLIAGASDRNPFFFPVDAKLEQTIKEARVMELINAYRVRGHLIADIDPLHAMPMLYHPELDMETYGLTIWDLDREFITGRLAELRLLPFVKSSRILQRAYCGKVGIEYPPHPKQGSKRFGFETRYGNSSSNLNPFHLRSRKTSVEADLRRTVSNVSCIRNIWDRSDSRWKKLETIIPLLDR
jgi:hypothetical protein